MSYDLVVIGTGPGGYVCAIRAAQLGLKTAVVEKRKTHGGTCLNIGCIPSKALLHASQMFEDAQHHFADHGHRRSARRSSICQTMQAFKQEGVDGNVKGVEFLLKKNKIDAFFGTARIAAAGQVEVTAEDGSNADARDEEHRHRHGLRRDAPAGHRDRREGGRVLDRRSRTRERAEAPRGHRRRRDRPGARLGLAPPRLRGDRGRISRPHPARHGRRGRQAVPAHPRQAGLRVQARRPRSPASNDRQGRDAHRRARGRRRGRDHRGRRGARRHRPRALHAKGSASTRSASQKDNRAASSPTRISPPTSRASTPSAT